MRHQSRELALQILFQTEFAPQIQIADFLEIFEQTYDQEVIDYAHMLISGVISNKEAIDQLIQSTSQHWKIQRMAVVDRNILRLGIFEMKMMASPLKPNIVINEAVELAKKFGSSESGSFVNGLLDQAAQQA